MSSGSPAARRQTLHRFVLLAWLVYWAALTYLLLAPKVPRVPITISPRGLVVHFCTFAILGYCSVLARRTGGTGCTPAWALRWSVIYAGFGALTELLQPLTRRHSDLGDFLADAVGAVLVLTLAALRDAVHLHSNAYSSPRNENE